VIAKTKDMAATGLLFAPASFLNTPNKTLRSICNGCGAANAKFDFVPDKIYGTYIGYACNIHDWMYHEGRSIEDKEEADRVMLNNILRLIDIDCKKKWYKPKFLMRIRAKEYYLAVKHFGGPAFWAGKPSV